MRTFYAPLPAAIVFCCNSLCLNKKRRINKGRSTLTLKRIAIRTSGLLLFTIIALFIHGYHPYAEDAEIYLPGVLKTLNPSLFPANAEFFGEHAGHTLYPNLIAFSVRATHLALPQAAFLWELLSIFLLLAAKRSKGVPTKKRLAGARDAWRELRKRSGWDRACGRHVLQRTRRWRETGWG